MTRTTEPCLLVQRQSCATCIYRKDTHFDLPQLLKQIADPHMPGHFAGHRICHHSRTAVCRGFWNRHKDHFQMGQLAQRLGWVRYVTHKLFPIKVGPPVPPAIILTTPQFQLLRVMILDGPCLVEGRQLQTARSLIRRGLAQTEGTKVCISAYGRLVMQHAQGVLDMTEVTIGSVGSITITGLEPPVGV